MLPLNGKNLQMYCDLNILCKNAPHPALVTLHEGGEWGEQAQNQNHEAELSANAIVF